MIATYSNTFFLIAGPCVIEDEQSPFKIAERIAQICTPLNIPFIFKGSYKKANRTRLDSFTGIGDKKALEVLQAVGQKYNVPVLTDIHSEEEAELAAKYVDILQIPAFLCRQTELLVAAAKTGKFVNIKKGQFSSPESMQFAIDKVNAFNQGNVALTDRGTFFGYQDLVVDYRGLVKMKNLGVPVIMDCTHSLQQPNQTSGVTGGDPEMIETIAKAAIVVGADGLFIETHPEPHNALSDGANMLQLEKLETLLKKLIKIKAAITE